MQTGIGLCGLFRKGFKSYSKEDVKSIRSKLGLSAVEFGDLFFASKDTVKGWESGRRKPSCSSMRLLQFVELLADDKHKDINHRIRQAYR